jgi:hypothetical protein
MIERIAVLLAAGAFFIAGCDLRPRPFSSVFGSNGCRYQEATYSHGSNTCQSGTQYRCDDGQWKGWGRVCAENLPVAGKDCDLDGNVYSAGSARCLSGAQYRCDDGDWRSLALACIDGNDVPARVAPGERTCMYNGATVATQSTICKSGVAFHCEDGEWRNLGSGCR